MVRTCGKIRNEEVQERRTWRMKPQCTEPKIGKGRRDTSYSSSITIMFNGNIIIPVACFNLLKTTENSLR